MKYKKNVYKSLALITQFGINIIVPTFICTFIGLAIDKFFGTWFFIPLMILGMLAGMRNCYVMAMNVVNGDKKDKDQKRKE